MKSEISLRTRFKNFGTRTESEFEKVTPATSGRHLSRLQLTLSALVWPPPAIVFIANKPGHMFRAMNKRKTANAFAPHKRETTSLSAETRDNN